MIFSASLTPPVSAQDPVKDAKKLIDEGKAEKSARKVGQGIDSLAAAKTSEACDVLLDLLGFDQAERKAKRPGLPGDSRKKLISALATFADDATVGKIGAALLKLDSFADPSAAYDQYDLLKPLAKMPNSAAAEKIILAALAEDKNPYIKVAALEALRSASVEGAVTDKYVDPVVAIFSEKNKSWWNDWKILPINIFACLEYIANTDKNDACVKAVEATAELAQKWEQDKVQVDDRVRYFAGRMLKSLTGEIADVMSWQFWKWWTTQRRALGKAPKIDNAPKKHEGTKPRSIFATAPVGKRYVLALDMSLSMLEPLEITIEEIEKRPPQKPTSGSQKKEADAEEQKRREEEEKRIAEEERKRGIDALKKLPWQTITNKLELAREELARAISELPDGVFFSVILWSTEVEVVTNGFVKSDASSRSKWSSEARKIEAVALTNIHGALMASLRVNGKTYTPGMPAEPGTDKDCMISGADCIIFMTDGWASWSDDCTSQNTPDPRGGGGIIGDGTHMMGNEIWPDIARRNLFRKVVINCIGIGHHDKECLKNIAKDSGGTYIDWSFKKK